MAAELVPVRLGLTEGDFYTLYAPSWRDAHDEWQAFLGKDDDLFGFATAADLAAFVRADRDSDDHDLADHPAWTALTEASAHRCDPTPEQCHDLVGVPELVAEKPTEESVATLLAALRVLQALGSVCDLTPVQKMFNGNPVLGTVGGGMAAFAGRAGRKRWSEIAAVVDTGWDAVIDALDTVITTPDVDAAAAEKAAAELAEPDPAESDTDGDTDGAPVAAEDSTEETGDTEAGDTEADDPLAAVAAAQVLGSDADFWGRVGIDPIQIITGSATYYTLRCYLDDTPLFLGRNGRISVFGSERALARYLADEHESDLSDLSTFDDIRTAATDGSLRIKVTDDNVYVLGELADDIADGPEAVDAGQLELVVEFLRDVSDYAEDTSVGEALADDAPLGRYVNHVLDPKAPAPQTPYAPAVTAYEQAAAFAESRLRSE